MSSSSETTSNAAASLPESEQRVNKTANQRLWGEPIGEYFDYEWYMERYPDRAESIHSKFSHQYPSGSDQLKFLQHQPGMVEAQMRAFAKDDYENNGKSLGYYGSELHESGFNPDYYIKNELTDEERQALGIINVNALTQEDKDKAATHWKNVGYNEGRKPAAPGLQEMLTQDFDSSKNSSQDMVDTIGTGRNEYLDAIEGTSLNRNTANTSLAENQQGLTNTTLDALAKSLSNWEYGDAGKGEKGIRGYIADNDKITDAYRGLATGPRVNLTGAGVSGAPIQITTGSQAHAANLVNDRTDQNTSLLDSILNARAIKAQTGYNYNTASNALTSDMANQNATNTEWLAGEKFNQGTQQAQLQNDHSQNYLPNTPANAFLDYLTSLDTQNLNRAAGLPTTTVSSSYDQGSLHSDDFLSLGLGALSSPGGNEMLENLATSDPVKYVGTKISEGYDWVADSMSDWWNSQPPSRDDVVVT